MITAPLAAPYMARCIGVFSWAYIANVNSIHCRLIELDSPPTCSCVYLYTQVYLGNQKIQAAVKFCDASRPYLLEKCRYEKIIKEILRLATEIDL